MNAPKRWIDTEGGSNDFERALLEPALQIEIPPGAEQNVWLGLAGLVVSASLPVAGAAASAGGAEAATFAGSGGASAVGAGSAKVAVIALIKAFAVGACSGALLAGGYSVLASRHTEPGTSSGAAQTAPAGNALMPKSKARAQALPRSPEPPAEALPEASPPNARPFEPSAAREASSAPATAPAVAAFDPLEAAERAKPSEHTSRLRAEALVLRRAREALRRGDLASAFAALEVARSEFAGGMLGEEREALTIELLARSGQREAARQRARAFLHAFPRSAHVDRVRSFAE